MKSKKQTEMREVTYWTCANPRHRHTTQEIANACIAKKSTSKKETNTWTKELYLQVLNRNDAGETCAALGKEFGVCRERMRQVVARASRMRARGAL